MRNLRQEIEIALSGGTPRFVPLTYYDVLIPAGVDMRELQGKGLAITARRDVYRTRLSEVTVRQVHENDGVRRTIYETPLGCLQETHRLGAYNAYAPLEHLVKCRDDYRIAEFIVRNTSYEPAYDFFVEERNRIGYSGITIAHTCYSPLIDIQIRWVGQEQFCYDLADNEDAVMSLYALLREKHRAMYGIVASSPAEYCLYGGNIVPAMVGPARVRDFVLPCWEEFAGRLHEKGKKLGVHLDSDNRLIIDTIRDSPLDFIEAFTPPPDCSISVSEARTSWPGKKLWINFPSSVHVRSEHGIRDAAEEILRQAGDRDGFLMGITEDIPPQHLHRSLTAILQVIEEHPRG
jgi:hypothetical protein